MIFEALQLARQAHANQRRKYTDTPYVNHPIRVAAAVMMQPGTTQDMICAALLHDVVEDCDVEIDYILERFGPVVANLVDELTNKTKGSEEPRAVRKQKDRDRLKQAMPQTKLLKLLDRIDNLKEMAGAPDDFKRKYAQESIALAVAIGQDYPQLGGRIVELANQLNPDAPSPLDIAGERGTFAKMNPNPEGVL